MRQVHDVKAFILPFVQHDPLFLIIQQQANLEELLYEDAYLVEIDEAKHYSIAQVAEWLGITIAMLRYYMKPFEAYIFEQSTHQQLTLSAIIKLRMILLLKDKYRVKGLKELLRMNEADQCIQQQIVATTTVTEDVTQQVNILGQVLQQMIETGLFHFTPSDGQDNIHIAINDQFLTQYMQQHMVTLQKEHTQGLVQKIRARHIENEVMLSLRIEALQQFATQYKVSFWTKIFRAAQLNMEKEQFVLRYISQHLTNRLESALSRYYAP
ncbi:hypothetical protein [Lysinibacillus piscis]|uniref:Uncharacterized protein n=1 Tax=Lysinibacillus piscis TaxID=2518931 RepID=A0ABQ5NFW3_9BACI|nr:hypothetical protein [Lysinibacillus sp. KH24]GLC87170.1 hypothetical protein LYSBPC_02970 [Lysinibacillus sp. KH24]